MQRKKNILLCNYKNRGENNMKKLVLTLSIVLAASGAAFADGNAFTPLNFNDTAYGTTQPAPVATSNASSLDGEAVGNCNIQNAIQQLDNAQIDIRNDLLNCKTKYADIDAQYKLIKAERNTLKKQVKTIEKRIKDIDKAKEKIRKNMS